MALLEELYQDLIKLSAKIKTGIDPKDIEEFQNTLNRSVPSPNSPDWLRYEEFRLSFQRGGRRMVIDIRKCDDDDLYRSRVLWTSANYIVQEFELEEFLYIEWQRDKYYKVFLKQVLDDLPDPLEAGYSFEYKCDTPKQKANYRQKLTASSPSSSSHKLDEGFIHVGTAKNAQRVQPKMNPNKVTYNKTGKNQDKHSTHLKDLKESKDLKNTGKAPRSDGFETVQRRQIKQSSQPSTKKNESDQDTLAVPIQRVEMRRSAPDIPTTTFEMSPFKPLNVGTSWADMDDDDDDGIF